MLICSKWSKCSVVNVKRPAPHVRARVLLGLREAIEKHNSITWDAAISVAIWVVQQTAGAHTTLPFVEDTSWGDTRSVILDLLDRALTIPNGKPGSILPRTATPSGPSSIPSRQTPTPRQQARHSTVRQQPERTTPRCQHDPRQSHRSKDQVRLWLQSNGTTFADMQKSRRCSTSTLPPTRASPSTPSTDDSSPTWSTST